MTISTTLLNLIKPQSWTDRVQDLLADHPQLKAEVLTGISKPAIAQDLDCDLDIWFDNKIALVVSLDGQILHEREFESDYRPDLMCIYGAAELLFLKIYGEVLLNRLPTSFSPAIRNRSVIL